MGLTREELKAILREDDSDDEKGSGRGRRSKGDDDDSKFGSGRRGTGRKAKGDDDDDMKASGRRSKGDDDDDDVKATGRRGRGRRSKGDDDDDKYGSGRKSKGDDDDDDKPATGRRSRGRKAKGAEGYDENEDNKRGYVGNYDPGVGDDDDRQVLGRGRKSKGDDDDQDDDDKASGRGRRSKGDDDDDDMKASGRRSKGRRSKGDDDDEDIIKEGIALLFEDVDTGSLDPKFRRKAEVIFEAAVNTKAEQIREDILLEHAELVQEEMESLTETINEKLDQYLTEAIATWFEANEVGIENSLKSEIMESLQNDLSRVLREHNVEIPESKVDLLESLGSKVEDLEERLNETITESIKLKKMLLAYEKQDVIDELAEGLSMSKADKFARLCESLDVSDIRTFRKKAELLFEQFGQVKGQDSEDDTLNEDTNEPRDPSVMEKLASKIGNFSGRRD